MEIKQINSYHPEILELTNSLLPQLTKSGINLSGEELVKIIEAKCTKLFVATENGKYYGMLTLATYRIPTGIKAWIEDLVVDTEARSKGIAQLLIRHALATAKGLGAKAVMLTSRPSRLAANKLYKKLEFELKETNVYSFNPGNS